MNFKNKLKFINFFSLIISIFIFSNQNIFANTKSLSDWNPYELYTERIENFCKQYKKTDTNNELIYILNEGNYFIDLSKKNITDGFKEAKINYEKNMDWIFDCGTLSTYQRSLELIKNTLIKETPHLNSKLKWKLEQKINEVKQKMKNLEWKCTIKKSNNNFVKLAVLNQATYETCKYDFYLEYLKKYYSNLENLVWKNDSTILNATNTYNSKIKEIDSEISKIYKVFPVAMQAFNDYENNISNHILLELLKEDYQLLRIWLHKTLNPINQVVYKIKNAMQK